jgi:iron complex outermembrane receptor protein
MTRSAILLGAILGFGASQATQAQVADSRTAAKPAAALEEIVVTAERRSERLDQVPIAATVISGEDLSQQGVSNIQDLGTVAPSINIQNQQALSYVNIRGVGLQATNPTTSSMGTMSMICMCPIFASVVTYC